MKIRHDFVSNSSSCSFFVYLENQADVDEFKKLVDVLKSMNVYMWLFKDLAAANDRWYGELLDDSKDWLDGLAAGQYVLCDSGDDHYYGYEDKFYAMESKFLDGPHKFKLFSDFEAHMSSGDKLPKADGIDEFFQKIGTDR